MDGMLCTDGGGLAAAGQRPQGLPGPARGGRGVHQGRHQPLPRPPQAGGDRGLLARHAQRGRHRQAPARALPRARSASAARSARARALQRHRRAETTPSPGASPQTRALVREVTRKSMVLLKNTAQPAAARARQVHSRRGRRPAREHGAARLVLGHAALHGVAARGDRARGRPGVTVPRRATTASLGRRHERRGRRAARSTTCGRVRRQPPGGNAGWAVVDLAERGQGGGRPQGDHAAGRADELRAERRRGEPEDGRRR